MRKIVLCLMVMSVGAFTMSAFGKPIATQIALLPTAKKHAGIWGLGFSPDNIHLAVGTGSQLEIWDWRKHVVEDIELPPGANPRLGTRPIQYSPDGKLLALLVMGSDDLLVRIFNTDNWSVQKDFVEHVSGAVNALAFTKDSNYLLMARDRGITGNALVAYSRAGWGEAWRLDLGAFRSEYLRLSPDGRRVALDGHVVVIAPPSVTNATERARLYKIKPHAYVIEVSSHAIEHAFEGDARGSLVWNPGSNQVSVFGNQYLETYDVKTGLLVNKSKDEAMGNTSAEYTMDGRYYIYSDATALHTGQGVRIWNSSKRLLLQTIPGDSFCMDVSFDSQFFVTDSNDGAQVWRLD